MFAFFAPKKGDGEASTSLMKKHIREAQQISIGAHRFMYADMIAALEAQLRADTSLKIRLVADDDLYWLAPWDGQNPVQPVEGSEPHETGDNMNDEAWNVKKLWLAGTGCSTMSTCNKASRFQVKYMETNHPAHLLHHNKYLIFEKKAGFANAVLFGAANLTGAGFGTSSSPNYENMYITTIPAIVDIFRTQYARVWDGRKVTSSSKYIGDDEFYGDPSCKEKPVKEACTESSECSWTGTACKPVYTLPRATAPADMPIGDPLPSL
jgi:hypothetical protein